MLAELLKESCERTAAASASGNMLRRLWCYDVSGERPVHTQRFGKLPYRTRGTVMVGGWRDAGQACPSVPATAALALPAHTPESVVVPWTETPSRVNTRQLWMSSAKATCKHRCPQVQGWAGRPTQRILWCLHFWARTSRIYAPCGRTDVQM